MLEPVGKVGGIQETERLAIDGIDFLGDFGRFGHQIGSGPAGRDDSVALDLEPFLDQFDVCRAADSVRPFNGNEFAFEVTRI